MRYIRQQILRIFLLVSLMLMTQLAVAGEILKDVVIKDKGDIIELTAKMGLPFKFIKHFPSRRGKIIQIQIAAGDNAVDKKFLKRRDTIKSPANNAIEIRDVIYEGNVRGGPYLVLRFPEVVDFSIKPMTVSDEITILIKHESKEPEQKQQTSEATDESGLDQMMRDARIALTNGKNSDAILLFSEILKKNNPKYMADAKEYLGLARERSGQLEIAKQEYEEYLKLYPKNRRAGTVKQRLMTLNARLAAPKRELKESRRLTEMQDDKFKRVDVFGRVSSYYYDAHIKKEGAEQAGYEAQQNLIMNFLDLTRRQRDQEKEIRYVFSGSHETDLLEGVYMEARVRSLYFDYKNKLNGIEVSVGRQSVNSGGVLGRFDGGVLGFRVKPKIKAFLVAGMPVDFINHREIQTEKPTLGARLDFDELRKNWKGSIYAIEQKANGLSGMVNRRAIGADARYFFNKKIFYSLIDYDIAYSELNFLTFHYGWEINEKTKMDFHLDKRKSPVMLSSNAVLGLSNISDSNKLGANVDLDKAKTALTVQELLDSGMTVEEIMKRAKDNTGEALLITASLRRILMKDLDFNGTLTLSSYKAGAELDDDDDEPEDTSFLPSTLDYSVNTQLIKRNLFVDRDIVLGGFRITNNESSRRYEVNGNLRYPFNKKFWINPKFRVMYTINKAKDKDSVRLSPKLHTEYKYNKKLSFEGEIGVDYNKSSIEGEDYTWASANAGFRYIF